MAGYKKMTNRERTEFKKLIKPLLEQGMNNEEVATQLNKSGHRLPGNRAVTRSCVALYATQVHRRRRNPTAKANREPKASVPVTGRIGLISEVLTLPGLSDAKRLELIRVLSRANS